MNSSSKNGSTSGPGAVGNIEHVVVLMFENRSFDHILGAMPGVDGVLDAQGNVLPGLYNTMDPTAELGDDNPAWALRSAAAQHFSQVFGQPN